nr:uncharacterized protein LOC127298197 [Lolium perenne]
MVLWQAPESREETSTPHVEVEDYESIDEDDEMMQADLEALEHDPGKRIPISMYDVNDQDRVRRRFIEMGPCQPKNHKFEFTNKGGRERPYFPVGRPRRGVCNGVINYHRFKVDMFVSVIDRQIGELNGRFDEVNTELLICMASFSPLHLFAAYDQEKLVKLSTKFYASDFTRDELARLPWQLNMYVANLHRDERFQNLKNLSELSVMLVKTKKHEQYHIVYKLLKLVLILPVATASVERMFSSMSYLKNKLRNKMGDDYLNYCMVTFVERDFFSQVKDEDIINRFQKGKRKVIM